MVSKDKYKTIITKFLDKWQDAMSKEMIEAVSNVYLWIVGYAEVAADVRKDPERVKTYLRRGINLMKRFVDLAEHENAVITGSLVDCGMAILKGDTKRCTPARKKQLELLRSDYNKFTSQMIGCYDATKDYFLSSVQEVSKFLGDDYSTIVSKIDAMCMHLKISELKTF